VVAVVVWAAVVWMEEFAAGETESVAELAAVSGEEIVAAAEVEFDLLYGVVAGVARGIDLLEGVAIGCVSDVDDSIAAGVVGLEVECQSQRRSTWNHLLKECYR
jgi:hypothetical protein